MGANSTQAAGVLIFLLAFVILAAAMAAGGNLFLILTAVAALAVAAGIFLRAKSWEREEG